MSLHSAAEHDTFHAFHTFVADILGGLGNRTIEEALVEYRAFQADRQRVLDRLALARLESQRGQSSELHDAQFWSQVHDRLDKAGVPN